MPPPYATHAELRIVGELHGSEVINVLHFGSHTVINDGDPLDLLIQLAAAMLACAVDTLLPAVTSDYTLKRVEAKVLSPFLSDPVEVAAPGGSVGTLGPTSVSFASSLLNLSTGGGGRRGRGKMFLPPAGEANITASVIDGPTLALLAAFIACVVGKFVGEAGSEDWVLTILSKTAMEEDGASFDAASRDVKTIVANDVVAKMGSRKKGVGA